jgi:hypothetical protein
MNVSPWFRALPLLLATALPLAAHASTPLAMSYTITPTAMGAYTYHFELTLANRDGSWFSGMNFNWIVFGDGFPQTTLPDFVGDVTSLAGGPFTSFTTSSGGNNGPTLLSHVPTVETGGWVPVAVGDSITWSGESAAYVGRGRMLFSNALGSPDNPALYEVATLLPVPEPSALALMTLGLLALGWRARAVGCRLRPAAAA